MFLGPPMFLGQTQAERTQEIQATQMKQALMADIGIPPQADPDGNPPPSDGVTPQPTDKPKKSTGLLWALGLGAVGVGLVYLAVNTPVGALDEKK